MPTGCGAHFFAHQTPPARLFSATASLAGSTSPIVCDPGFGLISGEEFYDCNAGEWLKSGTTDPTVDAVCGQCPALTSICDGTASGQGSDLRALSRPKERCLLCLKAERSLPVGLRARPCRAQREAWPATPVMRGPTTLGTYTSSPARLAKDPDQVSRTDNKALVRFPGGRNVGGLLDAGVRGESLRRDEGPGDGGEDHGGLLCRSRRHDSD